MPPWCESRWKHFFAISYHDPTIERWQDLFVSDLTNICWAQVVVSCFPLFHTFFITNSLFSHQNYAKEKKQPKGNFDQLMVKIYNTYFQQSKKPFYDLPSLMYLFLFIILSLASCFKWKKYTQINHFPNQEFRKIYIILEIKLVSFSGVNSNIAAVLSWCCLAVFGLTTQFTWDIICD